MPTAIALADAPTASVIRDLGWRSVLLDRRLAWSGIAAADVPLQVDLEDWDRVGLTVGDLHARSPVHAVVSARPECAPLAAYVAALLNLPGLSVHAAQNCASVLRTRLVLEASGIPTLRWAPALDADDAVRVAQVIGFPVAVRTSLVAGGEKAFICHDPAAVRKAAAVLQDRAPMPATIQVIESWWPGPWFIAHALCVEGRVEVIAVLEAVMTAGGRRVLLAARWPPAISPDVLQSITATARASLMALDVTNIVASVQLQAAQNGIHVLAVEPGVPTEPLRRLTQSVSGIDLARHAVAIALQLPLQRGEVSAGAAMVHYLWSEHGGMAAFPVNPVGKASGLGREAIVQIVVQPGESVRPLHDADAAPWGWILAEAEEMSQAVRYCCAAVERLALSPSLPVYWPWGAPWLPRWL